MKWTVVNVVLILSGRPLQATDNAQACRFIAAGQIISDQKLGHHAYHAHLPEHYSEFELRFLPNLDWFDF